MFKFYILFLKDYMLIYGMHYLQISYDIDLKRLLILKGLFHYLIEFLQKVINKFFKYNNFFKKIGYSCSL